MICRSSGFVRGSYRPPFDGCSLIAWIKEAFEIFDISDVENLLCRDIIERQFAAFGPPFETPTFAGRKTRSPIA
jgi:hypothetical protein